MHNIAELFQKEDYEPGEEEKLASIEYVNVRQSIDGIWSSIVRQFTIDELSTVEQLHAALGPGSFELLARNGKNSRIIAKPRVVVAPEPGESPRGRFAVGAPVPLAAPVMPQGTDKSDQFMMMMMQMMQQQSQQSQVMMQGMMTMITGVLTAGRQDSDKYTQQMAQMFTSFGTQQTALLQTVMQRGAASDPQAVFLQAVETVNEMRAGASEAKSEASVGSELQETMGMIAQGVDLYNKVKGPAGVVAAVTAEET